MTSLFTRPVDGDLVYGGLAQEDGYDDLDAFLRDSVRNAQKGDSLRTFGGPAAAGRASWKRHARRVEHCGGAGPPPRGEAYWFRADGADGDDFLQLSVEEDQLLRTLGQGAAAAAGDGALLYDEQGGVAVGRRTLLTRVAFSTGDLESLSYGRGHAPKPGARDAAFSRPGAGLLFGGAAAFAVPEADESGVEASAAVLSLPPLPRAFATTRQRTPTTRVAPPPTQPGAARRLPPLAPPFSLRPQALPLPEASREGPPRGRRTPVARPALRRVQSTGDMAAYGLAPLGAPLGSLLEGDQVPDDGLFRIGKYTLEERRLRILRYRQKRHERNFERKIKYSCRKVLADSRPRVRGRFAKNGGAAEAGPLGGEEDDAGSWEGRPRYDHGTGASTSGR